MPPVFVYVEVPAVAGPYRKVPVLQAVCYLERSGHVGDPRLAFVLDVGFYLFLWLFRLFVRQRRFLRCQVTV